MKRTALIIAVSILALGAVGYGGYRYWLLDQENQRLTKKIEQARGTLSSAFWDCAEAGSTLADLRIELEDTLSQVNGELGDIQTEISRFSDGYTNWREIVSDLENMAEISLEGDSLETMADDLSSQIEDIESTIDSVESTIAITDAGLDESQKGSRPQRPPKPQRPL